MGRAFEYRKATKMKRWAGMARTFTKIGKEIAIAVKESGPDPNNNPRLRAAIQNSKQANMPKANIENAIKRATSKDSENYSEVVYEGYGPHGVAFLVETTTDNPTRTVANVRLYFNRAGGSLGTNGSVEFMFVRKAVFRIKSEGINLEDLELELIDFGLDELRQEEEEILILTAFTDFGMMQKALDEKGLDVLSMEFQRVPNITKKLNDDEVEDLIKLIDRMEDDEDVQNVFTTMDMSE